MTYNSMIDSQMSDLLQMTNLLLMKIKRQATETVQ
jgi:hypothetical protein